MMLYSRGPEHLWTRTIRRLAQEEIPKMSVEARWDFMVRFQVVWDARRAAREHHQKTCLPH